MGAADVLRESGIRNPARVTALLRRTIERLELDLSGLVVLTEAASGPFVVTPVIASLAGASRVMALTDDSGYASSEQVTAQTRALEELAGVEHPVEIATQRDLTLFSEADLVTNLGFVRPIDQPVVDRMKETSVIALMCEAWERRASDVDVAACSARGIRVTGVNERYPGLEILDYTAWLAVKLMLHAQLEGLRTETAVVSTDPLGQAVAEQLKRQGLFVRPIPDLRRAESREELATVDALIVADYASEAPIVGDGGQISVADLVAINPALTVICIAGEVDVDGLLRAGLVVEPATRVPPRRMTVTLGALGVLPVVELHTAGLKAAEVVIRGEPGPDQGFRALVQLVDGALI